MPYFTDKLIRRQNASFPEIHFTASHVATRFRQRVAVFFIYNITTQRYGRNKDFVL